MMTKENFDPARPFRTRDGREVRNFGRGGSVGFIGSVAGCRYSWYPNGRYSFVPDHPLDLVNLPDAPPVEVEDKGETEATLRLIDDTELRVRNCDDTIFHKLRGDLLKCLAFARNSEALKAQLAIARHQRDLARRAVASAESVAWHPDQDREWQQAKRIADVVLDRPNADPDDDIAVLARQLLRKAERIEAAPPTTPAPASPAGGKIGETEIEAAAIAIADARSPVRITKLVDDVLCRDARRDATLALQAAACVRAASPDGEGWQPIETAPRDGNLFWIMVTRGKPFVPDIVWWLGRWWRDEKRHISLSYEPTHWRPLPPPPDARPDPAPAVAATSPDIIAVARAEERDYLRNEIVSLCEDTEQRYADVAERDTEGKQGAFSRGRIVEAKSIRKAICEVIRIRALTPVASVEVFGLLKIVDDWAYRWICDRSHQASGDPNFIHGYQRGASHVAVELRKLVIEHMPDFHQRVVAEQSRAALRSDQGGR